MSLPIATQSLFLAARKASESITERNCTESVTIFGTSTPIAALPGTGSILIPGAANFKAKSSAKLTILLTLTPGAGANSKRVTEGPLDTAKIVAFTLKSLRVCSIILL